MTEVKILRLKTGQDIICDLDIDEEGSLYIKNPMEISLKESGGKQMLELKHWLPLTIMETNVVKLDPRDVLTSFYPNEELVEYYIFTADEMDRLIETREQVNEFSQEEVIELIEAIEDLKYQTIQ